jgi:hypothetical protein
VFESTIRYLGGLLSAYELSGKTHDILLSKARELADKLAYAWPIVSGHDIFLLVVHVSLMLAAFPRPTR